MPSLSLKPSTVSRVLRRAAFAALCLAPALPSPTPVSGQVPDRAPIERADRDCRCVDPDGEPMADCFCVRAPRMNVRVLPALASFMGRRARLGVTLEPRANGGSGSVGALVRDVSPESPAYEAGLRAGDVVTRVDGHPLAQALDPDVEAGFDLDGSISVQRFLALAADFTPGRAVDIEYERDGESRATTVIAEPTRDGFGLDTEAFSRLEARLGDLSSRFGRVEGVWGAADASFSRCPAGEVGRAQRGLHWFAGCPGGVELMTLNPGLAEYFGTEAGVLVADVHEESPLGLRAGDVILAIGTRSVDSVEAARRILASYSPDETIEFRIRRRDRTLDVQGRLGVQ